MLTCNRDTKKVAMFLFDVLDEVHGMLKSTFDGSPSFLSTGRIFFFFFFFFCLFVCLFVLFICFVYLFCLLLLLDLLECTSSKCKNILYSLLFTFLLPKKKKAYHPNMRLCSQAWWIGDMYAPHMY